MLKLGVTTHVPLKRDKAFTLPVLTGAGQSVYTTSSDWSRTKRLHYQFRLEQDKAFTLPVQTGAGQSVYTTSSNWSRTKRLHYLLKLEQDKAFTLPVQTGAGFRDAPQTRLFSGVRKQWVIQCVVIRLANQTASNHRRTVVTLRLLHVHSLVFFLTIFFIPSLLKPS